MQKKAMFSPDWVYADYGLVYNSDGYSYTEVTITFPRHQKSDPFLLQKEAKQ